MAKSAPPQSRAEALAEILTSASVQQSLTPNVAKAVTDASSDVKFCREEYGMWSPDWRTALERVNTARDLALEDRVRLNKLARLVVWHLPEVKTQYVRASAVWRHDDPNAPLVAIVQELRDIEDAALRGLGPNAENEAQPERGWKFEAGGVRFRGVEYPMPPKPLAILKLIIGSRKRVLTADDLREVWGEDGPNLVSDASVRGHVGTIRKMLIKVASDIYPADEAITDPIPYVDDAGWEFKMPRE